jgi:hypothetical protein
LEQGSRVPGPQSNTGAPRENAGAGAARPDAAAAAHGQEASAEALPQGPGGGNAQGVRQPLPSSGSKPSGEPLVTAGIFHFEEGNYAKAEQLLRSSLTAGLSNGADRAQAHKYLAFIYCVTERPAQCRTEFRRALKADPAFSLTAAEAGHPTWGPAFRTAKGIR